MVFSYNVVKYQGEKMKPRHRMEICQGRQQSSARYIHPVSSPLSLIDDICAAFVTMFRLASLSE